MHLVAGDPPAELGGPSVSLKALELPWSEFPRTVAVGPGGWAVAAWVDDQSEAVEAAVLRPDGSILRAALGDGIRGWGPAAAIDARGNAIVAWSSRDGVQIARSPFLRSVTVRGGHDPAVALSPAGRELVAWCSDDGIATLADGVVDPDAWCAEIAAAVTDDGAAVIAHHAYEDGVRVLGRSAGGAWSAARLVAGEWPPIAPVEYDGERELALALGRDGCATLGWKRELRVFGVAGRAGGAWGAAGPLSARVRHAWRPGADVDASGVPWVVWDESDLGGRRGARWAPALAARAELPVVTVDWPARLGPISDPSVGIAVVVRCSTDADARLQVDEHRMGETVALRAGEPCELFMDHWDAELLAPDFGGVLPLEVVVDDRADHVVRVARGVPVDVVRVPLRTFRVAVDHQFWMFSDEGNRLMAALVNELIDGLEAGEIDDASRFYKAGVARLDRLGHDEHGETMCREEICKALLLPLAFAGYWVESVVL